LKSHISDGGVADPLLHRAHRGQVLGEVVAAHPELDRAEALPEELLRLVGEGLHRLDPEAGAVVGGHRPGRAAQQCDQRHAARLAERVPGRHVQTGQGQPDQTGGVEQGELPAQLGLEIEGRELISLDHLEQALGAADDGGERPRGEAEDVGPPGHAVVGLEIEEHERRFRDGAAGAHRGATERDEHGARAKGPDLHGRDIASHPGRCQATAPPPASLTAGRTGADHQI
jgi:hypothetical protein